MMIATMIRMTMMARKSEETTTPAAFPVGFLINRGRSAISSVARYWRADRAGLLFPVHKMLDCATDGVMHISGH